jgi:hypothetical protein
MEIETSLIRTPKIFFINPIQEKFNDIKLK